MKSRKPMMVRMLDAVQGRFRRARPGSVLIMVVSLLVLLALIGTAAMSTSRMDRTSSLQNVKNIQVDLIAEGVRQMVLNVLTKDTTAGNTVDSAAVDPDTAVNPSVIVPPPPSLVDQANAILASLLPERQLMRDPTTGQPKYLTPPGPTASDVVFQNVSYPPVQTGFEQFTAGGVHLGPVKFDVPNEDSSNPVIYGLPVSKPAMVPTGFVAKDGTVYPALQARLPDGSAMTQFLNKNGTPSGQVSRLGQPFIAADTDGDGVADAMLVKLPITPVNGVTYYAAVRVVDNAAKINLNTANNPNNEIAVVMARNAAGVAAPVGLSFAGIYPASVWLDNMFDPTTQDTTAGEGNLTEADKFNGQRVFGNRLWGTGAPPVGGLAPYNYDQTPRNDFAFLTRGDALHNQLGRRLDNPSVAGPNPKAGGALWYYGNGVRPFGLPDAMALAHRFTLINPDLSDSTVEKTLFMTVKNNKWGVTKPYPLTAAGIAQWFGDNFDYQWQSNTPGDQNGAAWTNRTWLLRAMLTSFNPVSTAVPKVNNVAQDMYRIRYVSNYAAVDPAFRQNPPPTNPPPDAYIPVAIPDPNKAVEQQPLVATEQKVPNVYSGKANVNTASFEELWRRYFDVMSATAFTTPFDAGANEDIYTGSSFNHITPFASNVTENAGRMFRSPLRPEVPGAGSSQMPRMHPYQVMALRAAIAAANTIALRTDFDPPNTTIIDDRNIPFFDIILPQVDGQFFDHTRYPAQYNGATPIPPNFYGGLGATVYGVKRQPFITEVFLDNNTEQVVGPVGGPPPANPAARNQSGFAAIEIHNPYDRPLRIAGWKLGIVDRRLTNDAGQPAVNWQNQNGTPQMHVVDIPDNANADNTWTPDTAVPGAYASFIFGATDVIPPHGFIVVTNLIPTGTAPNSADIDTAQYSPADTKVDLITPAANDYTVGGARVVYCKKLHWMMNREVQLLRPVDRRLKDTGGADKGNWVVRWAPVDSFDATGIVHNVANTSGTGTPLATADEWHYVRSNDPANNRAWHFVYPGRYEAIAGTVTHHQGTETINWPTPATNPTPWVTAPTATALGLPDGHNSRDVGMDYPALVNASTFPIQIANSDFASQFNRSGAAPSAVFPLNGFARLGDIMQVTYIGSYTIWDADANWTTTVQAPLVAPAVSPPQKWVHQPGGFGSDTNTANGTNPLPPPVLPFPAGAGGQFIEINPVTMDAAFAEDTDPNDDVLRGTAAANSLALEDIGRFAPISFDRSAATGYPATPVADVNAWNYEDGSILVTQAITDSFQPADTWLKTNYPQDFWKGYECVIYNADPNTQYLWKAQVRRVASWDQNNNKITLESALAYTIPAPSSGLPLLYKFKLQRIRYGWASKLFDNFTTINAPADDYLPNVDPSMWSPLPEVVKNVSDPSRPPNRTGLPTEDDVPAEGLININTANWKTLAQLPLVMNPANPAQVHPGATEEMARRIVYFRDVDDGRGVDPTTLTPATIPPHPHGPFKSLNELTMVPGFTTAMGSIDPTNDLTRNPGAAMGDYSPMTATGDGVRWDFKEKYLMLTRISNLVTTKSDCFTAYIQVQGWRDAGTPDAKLAVQKRLSFIIDRSRLTTSTDRTPRVYNIPVSE